MRFYAVELQKSTNFYAIYGCDLFPVPIRIIGMHHDVSFFPTNCLTYKPTESDNHLDGIKVKTVLEVMGVSGQHMPAQSNTLDSHIVIVNCN